MESVISLSSVSSKASPSGGSSDSYVSVVSLSSESQRVPVSWDSGKKNKAIVHSEENLNHLQKVQEWMKTCTNNNNNEPEDDKETKKTTCIRYDFDKNTKNTASSLPQSLYTRTTPLFSYMEEAKKSSANNSRGCILNGVHKKNGDSNPASPESRKKELCSYLQLMKPGEEEKAPPCSSDRRRSSSRAQKRQTKAATRKKREQKIKETDIVSVIENPEEYKKFVDVINFPTLKSAKELNMDVEKFERHLRIKRKEAPNKYMPLPAKRMYEDTEDFEACMQEIIDEVKKKSKSGRGNGCLKKVERRRRFKFTLKRRQVKFTRTHSLRSKGYLRNISLNTLILRKSHLRRRKAAQERRRRFKEVTILKKEADDNVSKKAEVVVSPRCEIISVHTASDDENIDLKNFVDDMLELDKMSEEHRRNVIESRILTSSSITNLINKQQTQEEDVQRAYKIFSELSNETKKILEEKDEDSEEKENANAVAAGQETNLVTSVIYSEHDYADLTDKEHSQSTEEDEEEDEEESSECLSPVPIPNLEVLPVNQGIEIKSLHRSLTSTTSKNKLYSNNYGLHNWNSGSKIDSKKLNHSISISKKDGLVLRAFYQDYNLVIIQERSVSFWTQSALGNVLGAQNMWIPKGQSQRIPLNGTYTQKKATEMVISSETNVAYVELWTKEHKSEVREVPVADVFAIVYFWRLRQNGLDKKALQLENIKGFTDDVQYCVLRYYPRIIVSWHSVQGNEKKTKIHSYHLAVDFQTVANISEIQPVEHYVSSLHNIEDCDNLVMGCGENKITLWNVEYGYIVATIELSNIKSPISTLWVKCDRGFLFTIQECVDQELRLIAINGMNHSWKKLQNYNPPRNFDSLRGVCIENGILMAYYTQGILCWNAQTGELIVEEVTNDCEYIPSGKHVIMIINDKIIVRHSLSHLITAEEF